MTNSVWIAVSRHEGDITLVEDKLAYRSINLSRSRSFQQSPTFIAFVGKKAKAAALKHIFADLDEAIPIEPHGQIRLLSDPRTREDDSPVVYVDCELHNQAPSELRPHGREGAETRRRLAWTELLEAQPKADQRASLGHRLYTRVLAPFMSVFCFFAADMGGLRGVSEAIAEQAAMNSSPDLPQAALPRVLVVFPTASTAFDAEVWETKFVDMIIEAMIQYNSIAFRAREQAHDHLYACFQDIRILGVTPNSTVTARLKVLRARLQLQAGAARAARVSHQRLFLFGHFKALISAALDIFASDAQDSLQLAKATRILAPLSPEFPIHITELMAQLPRETSLWDLAVPLVASTLLLDSCPPGMHRRSSLSRNFRRPSTDLCAASLSTFTCFPGILPSALLYGYLWIHQSSVHPEHVCGVGQGRVRAASKHNGGGLSTLAPLQIYIGAGYEQYTPNSPFSRATELVSAVL